MDKGIRHRHFWNTQLGTVMAVADAESIYHLEFVELENIPEASTVSLMTPALELIKHEIECYFTGNLTQFTSIINISGPIFQQKVWSALASIPYGQTCTYGQLAAALGKPSASRAVGMAT